MPLALVFARQRKFICPLPCRNPALSYFTKKILDSLFRVSFLFLIHGVLFISPNTTYAVPSSEISKDEDQAIAFEVSSTRNLHFRLFTKDDNLILRLPNGHHAVFRTKPFMNKNESIHEKIYFHEMLGEIKSKLGRSVWSINDNSTIEFLGSYPIKFTSSNHPSLSFVYRQETSTSTNNRENLELLHLRSTSRDSILSIQNLLRRLEKAACPNEGNQCQNPDAPLPVGFGENTAQNTLQIDARPTDCYSYFTAYADIERGTEIEEALANHPPYVGSESGGHSFPIADYWNNGNVYVLISRDLTAASYDINENPEGLYNQLIQDGRNIFDNLMTPLTNDGQITHTELGVTTTLHASDVQLVHLDVVVQYGVMTQEQRAIFDQVSEELFASYGIVLRIIEIP